MITTTTTTIMMMMMTMIELMRDNIDDGIHLLFPIFPSFWIDLPDRHTDGQTQ